jgi:hypothetical protein
VFEDIPGPASMNGKPTFYQPWLDAPRPHAAPWTLVPALRAMPPIVRVVVLALVSAVLAAPSMAWAQAAVPARPATEKPATAAAADPAAAAAKPKPVRNPSFSTASVPVGSQKEKRSGMQRGLIQVITRLTGDTTVASNPVVRRAAGNVEALATASTFRQDAETVNGVPVYKTVLVVDFDPDAIDALVGGAGLRYWTAARPKPILWLAIDDGRGPRLVTGKQTNVVKPLATRGLERGMRYLLPAGTAAEVAAVRSIVGLNPMALAPLTARYGNDAQLIGKVYRQPPGWAADWVMTQGGVELARWSYSDVDPRRVIASGVDEGANALAARDSVKVDAGAAGVYAVEVGGVNTQGQYLRLMGYLETLAIVRRIAVTEAVPGEVKLSLELAVGMRGFRTLLANGGVLRAPDVVDDATEEAPATGAARFELQ